MDYINTSHPNFVGGSKAVEIALQQIKSYDIAGPTARQKVSISIFCTDLFARRLTGSLANQNSGDSEKAPNTDRNLNSRAMLARQVNGIVPEHVSYLLPCSYSFAQMKL